MCSSDLATLPDEESKESPDGVERWARFTGRALGYVFVALLIVNLLTGWFF